MSGQTKKTNEQSKQKKTKKHTFRQRDTHQTEVVLVAVRLWCLIVIRWHRHKLPEQRQVL